MHLKTLNEALITFTYVLPHEVSYVTYTVFMMYSFFPSCLSAKTVVTSEIFQNVITDILSVKVTP